MTDWSTASSLATAAGTLVLAGATFSAVRAGNRSARASERALLAGILPVLVPTRADDPEVKVGFIDDHWARVTGGTASIEVTEEALYLTFSLKNVGNGLAVLDRWDFHPERLSTDDHRTPDAFRRLGRDLYVPTGDVGFWQGTFRDREDPAFAQAREAIENRRSMTIDLLYSDHEGGQRTISRFLLIPAADDVWLVSVGRHWRLDRDDPR
jgi:cbb3-type cytochrome oxidase subunit 3